MGQPGNAPERTSRRICARASSTARSWHITMGSSRTRMAAPHAKHGHPAMINDFIVVGAGISGASIAYHLKRMSAGNVLLLDRADAASGGTGKSAAIIRQSYSTPLLVRLARDSIGMLAAAKDELGHDSGFVQAGYCFLYSE